MHLLLNQTVIEIVDPAADTTLLQWLRESQHLTATKEGCAVGDCGACTVIVGQLAQGAIAYTSVNACIALLGSLHGCHVITLDTLQGPRLHPVQKAMLDCHSSQCGFCTPGFVMSLVVWWLNTPADALATPEAFAKHRHGVELALSGNLCRCTGYHPILLAADQLAPMDRATDPLFDQVGGYGHCLAQLQSMASKRHQVSAAAYAVPSNLAELALAYEASPEARLVAGSTDLALDITHGLKSIDRLIDLTGVAELQLMEERDKQIHIGAGVSLSEVETFCQKNLPAMSDLLGRFASRQVRNRGTLVGNVANSSPIADIPPLLLVMDAQLILQRGLNQRTIALKEFNLGYKQTALNTGEFIHSVILPLPSSGQRVWVEKVSKRAEDDISATCVAMSVTMEQGTITQINIACGGMAAIPKMASETQRQLLGQALTHQLVAQVPLWLAQDYQPIDDMRASAAYRQQVTANLVQGFLKEAMR
ncbi:MAG: xanthine dehydrogenase small subunit [Pseudomonadales bacterium]|jgi:xanthine dehydrogenase small subunit